MTAPLMWNEFLCVKPLFDSCVTQIGCKPKVKVKSQISSQLKTELASIAVKSIALTSHTFNLEAFTTCRTGTESNTCTLSVLDVLAHCRLCILIVAQ